MTKDEMIELAKQAGWQYAHGESGYEALWAFGKLVAEKEREECAKIADEWSVAYPHPSKTIAEQIRKRGQE